MIRPDEGMSALFPRGGPAPAAAPPAPGVTAELDIMGRLAVCLDGVAGAMQKLAEQRERARLSWEECHPVDLTPGISPGTPPAAGVIDEPDTWGPRQGWAWQILWQVGILGPAGTLMTAYRDAPIPANTLFASTVSGVWEPKALILLPGRRLVWSSAGDMLTVTAGQAVEIAIDKLPAYLM